MKFDSQKAFPYPVLRPDINDYLDGEFEVNVSLNGDSGDAIVAKMDVQLSVPEIEKQVANNHAEFVVVFSCRDTYFREAVTFTNHSRTKKFDGSAFRGEVQIHSFVVAKNDLTLKCRDINGEFGKGPFKFAKGEVLAIDEPRVVYVDRDMFRPVTSIFRLGKNDNLDDDEWAIDCEEDHVIIKFNERTKQRVEDARNSSKNKATLLNSVYFATVMELVQTLRESNDYEDLRWAAVFRKQCQNKGINLEEGTLSSVAQKLLERPLRFVFVDGE